MNHDSFIYRLMLEKTDKTSIQAIRYFIFGAIPTLVDMGLLWALRSIFGGEHLLWWTAIAFIVATFVTYLLSINFVFNNRNVKSKSLEIIIFFIVRTCGLGWTELLMWLLAEQIGMHYMLSKAIIVVLVFVWNFSMNKILLFRSAK